MGEQSSLGSAGQGERAPDPRILENRQPHCAGKVVCCVWFSLSKVAQLSFPGMKRKVFAKETVPQELASYGGDILISRAFL